jgi:hypothetical protein
MAGKRLFVIVTLLATGVGCPKEPSTLDHTNLCSTPNPTGARLSTEELCQIRLLREHCSLNDACLISCLTEGAGRNVAGGCWHVCLSQEKGKWSEPAGFGRCAAATRATPRLEAVQLAVADGRTRRSLRSLSRLQLNASIVGRLSRTWHARQNAFSGYAEQDGISTEPLVGEEFRRTPV